MTISTSVTPKEIMVQHRIALADYARRVLVDGGFLDRNEEADLAVRMREFLAVGISFKCTEGELVKLLYQGLFRGHLGCDCFTCKSRRTAEQPTGEISGI